MVKGWGIGGGVALWSNRKLRNIALGSHLMFSYVAPGSHPVFSYVALDSHLVFSFVGCGFSHSVVHFHTELANQLVVSERCPKNKQSESVFHRICFIYCLIIVSE